VYCDNQGALDRIQKLRNQSSVQPGDTITDDYDIYAAIRNTLNELKPINAKFIHVKGHQDQAQKKKPLSLPAKLNIECNKRATEYLPMARTTKQQPNPSIPQCYPHLVINQHVVVRELQESLRSAASTQDYRAYMQRKHRWSPRDCDNVNWGSMKLALRQFTRPDRQRLQKFLHDWLPLNDAPHTRQPASDRTCPVCQQAPENYWHFLECQHPSRASEYRQLQQELRQLHETHQIDPHMLQLLWQGLNSIHQQYSIDEQLATYPSEFHPLFHDQSRIGWDQLFYGRTSITWASYIERATQYKTNGTVFYSQIITKIWRYILNIWTIRNAAKHPSQQNQQTVQSLAPQVHHLFQIIASEPTLHGHEPSLSPDQILQQPIRTIRNFLTTGYRQMRTHTTAARTRAIAKTRDIRSYFGNLFSNNDQRPP